MTGKSNTEITILYFASLGEQLGMESERIELSASMTNIAALKAILCARGKNWHKLLTASSLNCALNQHLVDDTATLKPGDEIAFFPPVTGG